MRFVILFWIATLIVGGFVGAFQATAATHTAPTATAEDNQRALEELEDAAFGPQLECLAGYQLQSVVFGFPTSLPEQYQAGQTLTVPLTLANRNAHALLRGRVIVQIFREEPPAVSDSQWHGLVDEIVLPEDLSLAPHASRQTTFTWQIPSQAPAGGYRLFFHYQTDSRFSISGLPYVTNVAGAGGRVRFTVEQPRAAESALRFNRTDVRVNGTRVVFRQPAPTFAEAKNTTVEMPLSALGPVPLQTAVQIGAYRWDTTEGATPQPLHEETRALTLRPGARGRVAFSWTPPGPGTYTVAARATTRDPTVLPSLIKIRFSVLGFAPRLIFSGPTGNGKITACVGNATSPAISETPPGEGTLDIAVRSADGAEVGQRQSPISAFVVSGSSLTYPSDARGLTLTVQAKDATGAVTDSYETRLPDPRDGGTRAAGRTLSGRAAVLALLVVLALGGILLLIVIRFRRHA